MTYKKTLILIFSLLLIIVTGCNSGTIDTKTFHFSKLNDVVFEIDLLENEFSFLEGNNIADGDYLVVGNNLIIKKDYLVNFNHGSYLFKVYRTSGVISIKVNVDAINRKHQIINGGFETGDLFGWSVHTIFKGEDNIQSFLEEGIKHNDTFFTFNAPYNGDGKYVYGLDDRDGINKDRWNERMGIMRSSIFELGGSGFITFKLGGAKNQDLSYISIRNADTDIEVARYSNPKFNSTSYISYPENYFEANLVKYRADLRPYLKQNLYIEICDYGGRDWDLLTFDSFETYHQNEPDDGEVAVDIKPYFGDIYVPNQLRNGNFTNNLEHWTISTASGWTNNTFHVSNNILRSNLNGDASRGMIRSSLFRIDGSGVISLELGAAQGARYDKDTYISIRLENTNREIYRFANTRANGIFMVKYYLDLSAYLNENCYIEIVDNAQGSYDTIFVGNIITYYETAPHYNYEEIAKNLNY